MKHRAYRVIFLCIIISSICTQAVAGGAHREFAYKKLLEDYQNLHNPSPELLDFVHGTAQAAGISFADYIIFESCSKPRVGAVIEKTSHREGVLIIKTTRSIDQEFQLSAQEKEDIIFDIYYSYAKHFLHSPLIKSQLLRAARMLGYAIAIILTPGILMGYPEVLSWMSYEYKNYLVCGGELILIGIFEYLISIIPDLEYYYYSDSYLWALNQITKNYGPHFLMRELQEYVTFEETYSTYNPLHYLMSPRKTIGKCLLEALHAAGIAPQAISHKEAA